MSPTPANPKPALAALTAPLLGALTLGLAPFAPEPHIVGKLRWLAGGAVGMQGMDWFDLLLHGAPWLWLLWSVARIALARRGVGGPRSSSAHADRPDASPARRD